MSVWLLVIISEDRHWLVLKDLPVRERGTVTHRNPRYQKQP